MEKNKKYAFFLLLLIMMIIGSVFLWQKLYENNLADFSKGRTGVTKTNIKLLASKNETPPLFKEIKILFLGDLMADRYIRQVMDKKGVDYVFSPIKDLLNSEDLVIANLEGPITDNNSVSVNTVPGEKNHLIFTFNSVLAPALFRQNIKLVNIGNNHMTNFNNSGYLETIKYLEENKINYFGDVYLENKYFVENIGRTKVGFVNYNQFSSDSAQRAIANIKNLKNQSDVVIVFAHWGIEYKPDPPEAVRNLARKFIDSGADLIIGTHPHIIEPTEIYKNKKIYYSLGNFIFDQYFSDETKKGLAVEVKINPKDKSINFTDFNLSLETSGQTIIKN
ncbi:MAG TPA: CapA family protein [Patescibacteria group bacterium]|nr:CapA family protein [Patescibacteria group bacterium]